ncbi:SCP2 domain-containing protein [Glaciecola sp. SC05]|uniref:ubiquinone biosynthesis accessory factor UbiJ n=1 Tax=Glaciecola sp. SC05 TaxID=1987355 RepID=UPI0035299D29
MPANQALCALIELSINQALAASLNGKELIAPLADKRCILFLQELETTLAFQFSSERIDVLSLDTVEPEYLQEMPDDESYISVSLFALPELKKTSQLTKLIKQGKLDFYGDLGIVQKFSQVFANIEFDIEESLSHYIGDASAYTVMSQSKKWQTHAKKQVALFMQMVSDAALEEKPIAVRPIMLANFVDEVRLLKMDTERLEAKLNQFALARENK